jgi:uncharacterized DUF497 family protein
MLPAPRVSQHYSAVLDSLQSLGWHYFMNGQFEDGLSVLERGFELFVFALTVADDFADEERFVTLGTDAFGRLLVISYTWRGEHTIRMISARKATRPERTQYEG